MDKTKPKLILRRAIPTAQNRFNATVTFEFLDTVSWNWALECKAGLADEIESAIMLANSGVVPRALKLINAKTARLGSLQRHVNRLEREAKIKKESAENLAASYKTDRDEIAKAARAFREAVRNAATAGEFADAEEIMDAEEELTEALKRIDP